MWKKARLTVGKLVIHLTYATRVRALSGVVPFTVLSSSPHWGFGVALQTIYLVPLLLLEY